MSVFFAVLSLAVTLTFCWPQISGSLCVSIWCSDPKSGYFHKEHLFSNTFRNTNLQHKTLNYNCYMQASYIQKNERFIIIIIIIIRGFRPRAGIWLQTQEPRLQFCPKGGFPLQTQEPRLQFCPKAFLFHWKRRNQGCSSVQRQIFHCKVRNQSCISRCGSFPLLSAERFILIENHLVTETMNKKSLW